MVAIANFIITILENNNVPNIKYELLAYHRLRESKYEFIGRKSSLNPALTIKPKKIETLRKIANSKLNIEVL